MTLKILCRRISKYRSGGGGRGGGQSGVGDKADEGRYYFTTGRQISLDKKACGNSLAVFDQIFMQRLKPVGKTEFP